MRLHLCACVPVSRATRTHCGGEWNGQGRSKERQGEGHKGQACGNAGGGFYERRFALHSSLPPSAAITAVAAGWRRLSGLVQRWRATLGLLPARSQKDLQESSEVMDAPALPAPPTTGGLGALPGPGACLLVRPTSGCRAAGMQSPMPPHPLLTAGVAACHRHYICSLLPRILATGSPGSL